MRLIFALASLLVFAASTSFAEPPAVSPGNSLTVTGSASFDGDSTLTKFHGECPDAAAGTLTVDGDSVWGDITVALASCKTGDDTRDAHMREAFDTAGHPLVTFVAKKGPLAGRQPVEGVLKIKGDSAPATASCTLQGSARERTAACSITVDLRKYPSVPPISKFGLVNVKPEVQVRVKLRAAPP